MISPGLNAKFQFVFNRTLTTHLPLTTWLTAGQPTCTSLPACMPVHLPACLPACLYLSVYACVCVCDCDGYTLQSLKNYVWPLWNDCKHCDCSESP